MSVRKRPEVDWDGLRYFLAVARAGTLSGAARDLRVEHTTIARRIDAIERELGAKLFLRNPRGYVATAVGEALVEAAQSMSVEVDRVVRLARGQDVEIEGTVRIATADLLATHVVVPALPALLRAHGQLRVEIVSDTRQHDLSRREADLALRLGASTDEHLITRRLGRLGFGLYTARARRMRVNVRTAPYVAFDESIGRLPHDEWLAERAPEARVVLRANRQHTLIEAVRQGLGLGILPCVAADDDASLARLEGPDEVFTRDISLVVHADVQ
ncbi:MAG TPA: LysR family transcriptional regulator, partial [Kofleriaceae bacterium]|nr:LysR family transcriptional regulator [Kofleriaceae bacterium]